MSHKLRSGIPGLSLKQIRGLGHSLSRRRTTKKGVHRERLFYEFSVGTVYFTTNLRVLSLILAK